MPQEIIMILSVFLLFILTGVFGGLGILSLFQHKKKRAIWCFAIGFILIIIFLVVMFSYGII